MGLNVQLGQLVVCHGYRRSSGSAGGLLCVSMFTWVRWWSAMGPDVHLGQLVVSAMRIDIHLSQLLVCHGLDVHLGQLVVCHGYRH